MFVYRIQPVGSDLHGIETTTSNDELAGGVHVFRSLEEAYGCREWHNDKNVELATIECDVRDVKETGDYEGLTLRKGCGQITARREFTDIKAIVSWIENTLGW